MKTNPSLSARLQTSLFVATICLAVLAVALVFPLRASNQTSSAPPDTSADALLGEQQVEKLWAAFAKLTSRRSISSSRRASRACTRTARATGRRNASSSPTSSSRPTFFSATRSRATATC